MLMKKPFIMSSNGWTMIDMVFVIIRNADILKIVYIAKKDIESYLSLCEKIGTTPKDCENIAGVGDAYCKSKKE